LSPKLNQLYYIGKVAHSVESPHTPKNMIWPLALIAEALTEVPQNSERRIHLLKMIIASDTGNHWLHESFNADEVSIFTRADFGRPNALFAKFLMQDFIGRKALPLSSIDDLH